jgi:hypothetical protein
MKKARSCFAFGSLAFNGRKLTVIMGESLIRELPRPDEIEALLAKKPLHLKDNLAIQAFTLDNFVLVWSNGDVAGVYFRLLFVALSLAVLDF